VRRVRWSRGPLPAARPLPQPPSSLMRSRTYRALGRPVSDAARMSGQTRPRWSPQMEDASSWNGLCSRNRGWASLSPREGSRVLAAIFLRDLHDQAQVGGDETGGQRRIRVLRKQNGGVMLLFSGHQRVCAELVQVSTNCGVVGDRKLAFAREADGLGDVAGGVRFQRCVPVCARSGGRLLFPLRAPGGRTRPALGSLRSTARRIDRVLLEAAPAFVGMPFSMASSVPKAASFHRSPKRHQVSVRFSAGVGVVDSKHSPSIATAVA